MSIPDVMNYTSLGTTITSEADIPQELVSNGREFQTWRRTRVLDLSPVIVLDVLVMLFGVIGNSVVCYVCLCRMQRTVINSFVLSLAAVELLGCIFTIPVDITELMNSYAFDFPVLCKTEKYFRKIVIFSTGCILVAIAAERYKRIVKPHGRHVTLAQFRAAIVVSLTLSVILAVPEAILAGSETIHTPYGIGVTCSVYHSDQFRHTIYPKVWGVVVVFIYVFSIAAIGITYTVIASKIWTRGKVHTNRRSRPNTPDSTLQRRVKRYPNKSEQDGCINGSAFNGLSLHHSFPRRPSSHCQMLTTITSNGNAKCDRPQCQKLQTPNEDTEQHKYYDTDVQRNGDVVHSHQPLYNHNHNEYCAVNNNDNLDVNSDKINQSDDIIKNYNDDEKKEDVAGDISIGHLVLANHDDDSNVTEVDSLMNKEPDNEDKVPVNINDDEDQDFPSIKEDNYFQINDEKFQLEADLNITSNNAHGHSDEDSEFQSHSGTQEGDDNDFRLRHNTMDSPRNRHEERRPTVFFSELIKSLSMRRLESFSHSRKRHSDQEHDCDTLHRLHSSLTPMGSFRRRKSTFSRKRTTFIMFVMTLTTALSHIPHISVMLYSLTRPGVEARLSPDVSVIFRLAWNSFFVSLASHPFVYGFWNGRFKHALWVLLMGFRRLRQRTERESFSSARHS